MDNGLAKMKEFSPDKKPPERENPEFFVAPKYLSLLRKYYKSDNELGDVLGYSGSHISGSCTTNSVRKAIEIASKALYEAIEENKPKTPLQVILTISDDALKAVTPIIVQFGGKVTELPR